MRIGAITRTGYMSTVRLSHEPGVSLVIQLTQYETEQIVSGLLMNLAQMDPLLWERIHADAREVRRSRGAVS